MPLSQPGGGSSTGLDRTKILVNRRILTDGSDPTLDFGSAYYRNNEGFLGAANSFVGFYDDLTGGKIIESAALPDTVTTGNSTVVSVFRNTATNAIQCVQTGFADRELAETIDGGATWALVNIPPGVAAAMQGWKNVGPRWIIVSTFAGGFDFFFTDNDAVAWTSQATGLDAVAGTTAREGPFISDSEDMAAIFTGTGFFAVSTDVANGLPPTWVIIDSNTLFGLTVQLLSGAFNADGSVFVAVGASGDIVFSDDGLTTFQIVDRDINPLINSTIVVGKISDIVYSAANAGFYIISNNETGALVLEADLANPVYVDVPTDTTIVPIPRGGGMADADNNVMFVDTGASLNKTYVTPQ